MNKEQVKEDLGDSYCALLFIEGALDDKGNAELRECMSNMAEAQLHVPYEKISKKIFQSDTNKLNAVIEGIDEKFDAAIEKENDYQQNCAKIQKGIFSLLLYKKHISMKNLKWLTMNWVR